MVVLGFGSVLLFVIHSRSSLYRVVFSLVYSCGMYVEMAMMGEPSCGVSVATVMWFLRCVGA